ncbi:MAG: hypothetical protein SF162_04960 [bacterium]|nr:hypothetical protein [bacterium]
MSLADYVKAMPKADIHVSLEGAVRKKTLKLLADINEIPDTQRHFNDWLNLIDKPDYKRLHELVRIIGGWIMEAEDLTRAVYDVGTALHNQNVRYAEVSVNPAVWTGLTLPADDFLAVINDGRERAFRAWGIRMAWVFTTPRDEPRRADEIARWVSSAAARKGGVVAFGLSGRESVQPVGQFERAFKAVEKKSVPRVVRAGDQQGAEGVLKTLETLVPTRLYDAWGIADAPDALNIIATQRIGVGINLTRAQKSGWVERIEDYPLRHLYDADVPIFLGNDMPTFYHTTLSEQYQLAVEKCGLGLDELEQIALNAVRQSCLGDEEKTEMMAAFAADYARLRVEYNLQPA